MQASSASESEKVIRRLYQITNSYHKGLDAQIAELLEMGLERFNLDIGILSKIDGNRYTIRNCICPEGRDLRKGEVFALDKTYCQVTCRENEPLAVEHVAESDYYRGHPAYEAFKLESYVGIPIFCDGSLYGTLNFSSAKPYHRRFNEIDIDVLQLMASWLEVELIRRKQEHQLKVLNEKLEILALYDPLTNLPNRRALFDSVPKSLRRLNYDHQIGAVAMVDIDYFKKVNDTYGHQFGDKILCETARRITHAMRESDYVARFGGEEFIVWLPKACRKDALAIAERIRHSVSEIVIDGTPLTVSIGLCVFEFNGCSLKAPAQLFDEFISTADKALYDSKDQGRNRTVVYQHPL